MLEMLYVQPPYRNLEALLRSVRTVDMGRRNATIQHLENVQLSFEGLLEVFEKQTRSPGIKSCYDLDEIRKAGKFVLTATGDKSRVLTLHLSTKVVEAEGDALDRAPSGGSALSDMRDALHRLFTSGHFSFQGGYTKEHSFALDGLPALRESLEGLERSFSQWEEVQREMRVQHFFLNYFTMRELLRLAGLLQMAIAEGIGRSGPG